MAAVGQGTTTTTRGYGWAWQTLTKKILSNHCQCNHCGTPGTADNPLTVDHIISKIRGGSDHPSNLQVLCRRCNSRRGG